MIGAHFSWGSPLLPRRLVLDRLNLVLVAAILLLGAPAAAAAQTAARPAPAHETLQIVVPLVADDAGLQQFARSVSTPGSPQYGQYEPLAVLAARFGATNPVQARAVSFLRSAGAREIAVSPTRMFVSATITVAQAERAFSTTLASFRSGKGVRFIAPVNRGKQASAAAVGLPAGLRGVATGVVGLDTQPLATGSAVQASPRLRSALRSRRSAHAATTQSPSGYLTPSGKPAGCAAGVHSDGFTPNQYLTAYGYNPLRSAGLRGGGERIAVIEQEGFRYSDLKTYARCFGLDIPRITTYSVGSHRSLPPGSESTLDLEVLDSVAPRLDSIEVYETTGDAATVFRGIVLPLITPGARPQVISVSLGLCEPNMLADFGRGGVLGVERDIELSAATGITLVAAAGDTGSSSCFTGNGQGVVDRLATMYPATSPFITAVGGTNLYLNANNTIDGQPVWNDTYIQPAAGGGGSSELFARPSFQNGVVSGAARAVPDVSMLADVAPGYAFYCTVRKACGGDKWSSIGGTSAAAPLLAGGVALVDEDLRRHGRRELGYMNPLLYAIGDTGGQRAGIFSDVTEIGNDLGSYLPGGNHQPLGCCTAGAGYDEASGWGSVNLAAFDQVAQRVLPKAPTISLRLLSRQHPLRQGGVRARLGCSGACTVYAFGVITVGSNTVLTAGSRTRSLRRRGTLILKVGFSAAQVRTIRRGLRHRQRVYAEVFGVEIDSHGDVARFTPGRVIRVRN